MIKLGYIKGYGINYVGTLPKLSKNDRELQPIFEALTNSFEAIKLANNKRTKKKVIIKVVFSPNLFSEQENTHNFEEFIIEDNGIGFNDDEFERLIFLNDTRKGFSNKGTGRVQFLHFFNKTNISSIYKDSSSKTGFRERVFELSKMKPFLEENAIINYISNNEINSKRNKTVIYIFQRPIIR